MKINIQNAADILSMSCDELLMEAQNTEELTAHFVPPTDMIYEEDGTVKFVDGDSEPSWEFEIDEVLAYKKVLDERNRIPLDEAVKSATKEMIGQ